MQLRWERRVNPFGRELKKVRTLWFVTDNAVITLIMPKAPRHLRPAGLGVERKGAGLVNPHPLEVGVMRTACSEAPGTLASHRLWGAQDTAGPVQGEGRCPQALSTRPSSAAPLLPVFPAFAPHLWKYPFHRVTVNSFFERVEETGVRGSEINRSGCFSQREEEGMRKWWGLESEPEVRHLGPKEKGTG